MRPFEKSYNMGRSLFEGELGAAIYTLMCILLTKIDEPRSRDFLCEAAIYQGVLRGKEIQRMINMEAFHLTASSDS